MKNKTTHLFFFPFPLDFSLQSCDVFTLCHKANMKYICGSCFMTKKKKKKTIGKVGKLFYFVKTFYKENGIKI